MNVAGSNGTAQAASASATVTSSGPGCASSKARLVFNADGSVKLLGDPTILPGTGINGNSHALVPTIGTDGTMTMLLTPSDGLGGKSFVLCPSNGSTLPNANVILPAPGVKSQGITNIGNQTLVKSSNVISSSGIKTPNVLSGKSLLSGMAVNTGPKYMTHMRIDPSGSSTSVLTVPISQSPTKTGHTTVTSKGNISYATQPFGNTKTKILHQTLEGIKSVTKVEPGLGTITLKPNSSPITLKPNSSPQEQKYSISKSPWSQLSSVLSLPTQTSTTPTPSSTTTLTPNIPQVINSQSNSYLVVPTAPKTSQSGTYTVVFAPSTTKPPAVQSVPSPTYMAISSAIPSCPSSRNTILSNTLKTLNSMPRPNVQKPAPYIVVSPKTKSDTVSSYILKDNKLIRVVNPLQQTLNSMKPSTQIPTKTSTVWIPPSIGQTQQKAESSVKPCVVKSEKVEPETDSIMSIKIDSVFSLSTKEAGETEVKVKSEPIDEDIQITNETKGKAQDPPEPMEIKCDPAYVVLEQLSKKQIDNPKECIFKCSNHCRVRTLNFLCNLGLVDCDPVVHTINPVKVKKEPENSEDKPAGNSEDKSALDRKRKTPSNPEGGTIEQVIAKQIPIKTLGASPAKVRKVDPPEKTDAKVLRFTKVDSDKLFGNTVTTNPAVHAKSSTLEKLAAKSSNGPESTSTVPSSPPKAKPFQLLGNMKPESKVIDSNKVQYYVFNHNGQKILVPVSNDVQKPKAFLLKSQNPIVTTKTVHGTSLLKQAVPKETTAAKSQASSSAQPPMQTTKNTTSKPKAEESLLGGIRIKSEPITRGYGDEDPVEPPKLEKIKQEPVNTEWQEMWSSASRLVADLSTKASKDKQKDSAAKTSKTSKSGDGPSLTPGNSSSKEGSSEEAPMPDLPLMKIPTSKEIAKKTAASNDRIERLKAMLKEKEKLIEDLKMQRRESAIGDEDGEKDTQKESESEKREKDVSDESEISKNKKLDELATASNHDQVKDPGLSTSTDSESTLSGTEDSAKVSFSNIDYGQSDSFADLV